jgi:peptidoglycan hydrolase-like protein with peptidoglycan-binding domain
MPPGVDHEQAVRNRDIVAARLTPAQLHAAQVRASTWQPPEMPPGDASARPLAPAVPPPSGASRVQQAQAHLKAAGFDPGPADGTLGPKTRDALRRYQRTKGLQATGELDEPTLDALRLR